MNHRFLLVLLATALAIGCGPRQVIVRTGVPDRSSITSASALVRAMHDRYAGKWYRNLTFVQTSQYYDTTGAPTRTELWYEAGQVPGMLRIDIGEPSAGTGQLFRNDSTYIFQRGKLTGSLRSRNPLMLLGFDVYAVDPARMVRMLAEEGFDTTKFHRATANDTEYFVVGAAPGDTASKQFWVEASRMLFWRVFLPPTARNPAVSEIRFQKYVPHGGGYVAEEVDFLRNGKRYLFESYDDVRVDVELDPALFDPSRWTTARHWR